MALAQSISAPTARFTNPWTLALGTMVGYCAGACFSGFFTVWVDGVSYFWLPSGLYLGLLLLSERKHWWIVVVSAFLGDLGFNRLFFPQDSWPAIMLATAHLGNTLSALLGAWLIQRFVARHPKLESLREFVLVIVLGGVVALPVTAIVGASMLGTLIDQVSVTSNGIAWYCSDLLGVLLLTPPLLLWFQRRRRRNARARLLRALEVTLLGYGLIGLTTASFLFGWPERTETLYASFPFVIWAAVRFGRRGAASTILMSAVIAHWFSAFGYGAIGSSDLSPAAKSLEMLVSIGLFALVGMVPAIVISSQRQAERRARLSEQRRSAAVRGSSAAFWEWDLATEEIEVSARLPELLGFPSQTIREPADELLARMPAEDAAAAREAIALHRQQPDTPIDIDLRFTDAQQKIRWFNLRGALLDLGTGAPRHITGSLIDVTERKSLEARVQHADKLAVIGQLAGGVAHDFNNILAAMIMNIELLQFDHPSGPTHNSLGELHRLSKRASRLTEQLLMFARRRPVRLQPLSISTALDELSQMLRRLLPETVSLELQIDDALWVRADAAMLDQVLLNLCLNARDAMPQGGELRIRAQAVELNESAPPVGRNERAQPRRGRYVRIAVIDNGIGMTAEVLSHIFEPFYTTKEIGKGTGLGLASSDGIIHQHDGWIDVDSTPQVGTTFSVHLPLVAAPRPEESSVSPFEPPPGGETILFVEDEPSVRLATANMLRTLGYEVIPAEDAADARRCLREHAGDIQLLFTDTIMPGDTDGVALGRELRKADPALRVLLTSGYSQQIVAGTHLGEKGFTFLAKPFDRVALARAIRLALERHPER